MKKIMKIVLTTALFAFQSVCANALPMAIELQLKPIMVSYDDPTVERDKPHRSPMVCPSLAIEDHTLYVPGSTCGSMLQLIDGTGTTIYSTTIPDGCDMLELPASLSGEYEIQLVRGAYCFYGYIEL